MKVTKKEEGTSAISSMLSMVLTVFLVAILLIVYFGHMANIDKRDTLDVIAREFILKMETTGYLTEELEDELIKKLNAVGLKNVDLTGTTRSEAGYGQQILLCIAGELQLNSYTLESIFGFQEKNEWTKITLPTKSSTAKH